MGELKTLRIVVASPSDVIPERKKLDDVVAELNHSDSVAGILGYRLEVSKWEKDAHPGFHESGPQGLIDSILRIDECDLFIGIFWARFGTPVADASSGTAHEFRVAYQHWKDSERPQIFFYFKKKAVSPDADLAQLAQVQEFKKNFPREGFYWEFSTSAEFERLLRRNLSAVLHRASSVESTDVGSSRPSARRRRRRPRPSPRREAIEMPSRQPLVDGDGPAEWHARLTKGSVEVELNPQSQQDVYAFTSVVKKVLTEHGFSPRALSSAVTVLGELLTNINRHVPGSAAWIAVKLEPEYFPSIRIAVCDSGPGIEKDVLDTEYRALASGEPEHGLLNVLRLANMSLFMPTEYRPPKSHCVRCEVYDPPQPTSMFFDYPFVAPIRVEYVWPKLFWIGRDDVYVVGPNSVSGFECALNVALDNQWPAILDPYFKSLSPPGASLLGIEVTGREVVSEPRPGIFERLQHALEMYLRSHFDERRVVLVAHETRPAVRDSVAEWARRWKLDYYEDETACRERLEELAPDFT
jgi:anti-sigma regulatory factor (Ser/Thr protein kinase)